MASVDNARDLTNSREHFASTPEPEQAPQDTASASPKQGSRLAPAPMPESNPWKRDQQVGRVTPEAFSPVPQPGSKQKKAEKQGWAPFGGSPTSGSSSGSPSQQQSRGGQRGADRNQKRKQRRTPEQEKPDGGSQNQKRAPQQRKKYPQHGQQQQGGHPQGQQNPPFDMTLSLLVQQFEYYFSIDNLCKDIYLRKQMNSKGFIPIQILADFNRVRILSNSDLALVTEACNWCPITEVVGSRVRLANGWERWVLPVEERDEAGAQDSESDEETPKFNLEKAVPFVPKRH